jgi:hypothetical protein
MNLSDIVVLAVLAVVWILLMSKILPRFGVPT